MNQWLNQQIGSKYEIKELLGRGGSGEVYRAYHAALQRDVAIKTIYTHTNDPKMIERFRREAQIVAALHHPHIVQVHDFDIADGTFYMVMEYVGEATLARRLKAIHDQGLQLPLPEALHLFQTICRAVAYAHSQGVVHADLKPANVLLREEMRPILADFGLSRMMGTERTSKSDALTGTPSYMAPEQCMGKGSDERSDIYSLGVMLFELTTGELPFTGDSVVAVILKHLDEPPPLPRSFNPDLPISLEQLILTMLQKEPGRRYQSVPALLEALDEVLVPLGGLPSVMLDTEIAQPADIRPCYRGLQPFEETHAEFYHGRNALVRQLLEYLGSVVAPLSAESDPGESGATWIVAPAAGGRQVSRFLAVLGASGSGKSSLIRAGLIPQLRMGELPGSQHWHIALMKPGQRPLHTLATIMREAAHSELPHLAELHANLSRDGRTLNRTIRATAVGQRHFLLVIDQFEEIFTLCEDENERRLFIENLLYAVAISDGPVIVLLTMRADFYHRCAVYRDLASRIASQQTLVGPLNETELRQAIVQPAQQVGLKFEPELVKVILGDVAQQPGALPLLQHALLELWERRQGRLLTLRAYQASGGVQGAIAQRADEVYAQFTSFEQAIVRRIMLRLTELGEAGGQATSRRASPAEFLSENTSFFVMNNILRTLADARLITLGDNLVEVAHEALIRNWPALQSWLAEDQEGLRIHQHLSEAAQAWATLNRDPGELYRGARLAQAAEWAAGHRSDLNPVEREFLQSSTAQAEQRSREQELQRQRELAQAQELAEAERQRAEIQARAGRRLWLLVAGLLLLLGLAGGAIWLANSRQQVLDARRLAFAAASEINTSPETAVLLAYEAVSRRHDFQSEQALRDALTAFTWASKPLVGHEAQVTKASFSPDGSLLLTTSWDGSARLWTAKGELLEVLTGHEDQIIDGRFSPDGLAILTASDDGSARLWDRRGSPLALFIGHSDRLTSATFSADGQYVLTASSDSTAILWSATGTPLLPFGGHDEGLTTAVFSPDGQLVLTASQDGTARLSQRDGRFLTALEGHEATIDLAIFSPNGQLILTGSEDKTARLWDLAGSELAVMSHNEPLTALAFNPDGQTFYTNAGRENTVRAWDLAGRPLATFHGHTRAIRTIRFSPDGQTILTASEDGTARLWALSGQLLVTLRDHTSALTDAQFSPDGQQIITASNDKLARIWSPVSPPTPPLLGHTDEVENTVYSADGRFLLTASTDTTARLWDANGNTVTTFVGHEGQVDTAFFSPDEQLVLTSSEDNTARLWNRNGQQQAQFTHEAELGSATFSPNGQLILTASDDGTAHLWTVTGETVASLIGHDGELQMATFSPDGQLVATAGEDFTARLWDLTGQQLAVLEGHEHELGIVAFGPNGTRLLTTSRDGTARLWDLSGQQLAILAGHTERIDYADFSPDGQMIATSSWDRTARLWNLAGNELAVLAGHVNAVKWVTFSPDGQKVVTASDDGSVRLWDLAGNLLTIFKGHPDWVATAEFSPDGTRVVTASRDFTARQFMVHVGDLLATAVCSVGRTLTEDEINRFDVGTPVLDLTNRQCPPVLSWQK